MSLIPLDQADRACSNIQLIATDMDGTLTVNEKFTPELFQALQKLQAANITVIVITGRSAGWVNAVNHYFPVAGAICENGGIFYQGEAAELLVEIADIDQHRQKLAAMFSTLQQRFPQIQEARDNRFRLTDWTFDVAGLSREDLHTMDQLCTTAGWGFTYSTVQCHIKLREQDKAPGLQRVLQTYFPQVPIAEVMTIGDSPNDVSMFNPAIFPNSTGVHNVIKYTDQLEYRPHFITQSEEGKGFCELATWLTGIK